MLRSPTLTAESVHAVTATFWTPLLGSILLALLVSACDSGAGKETTPEAPNRPVLVASVAYQNVNQTRSLAATIRPRVESDLGFRVSGKVAQRLIQNGDRVHKGQPLLQLDTNDLKLQLQLAEAEVRAATSSQAQAEADEARTTTLHKDGWSPTAALDKAHAAAAEARGRLIRGQRALELARNALAYATLEADADGVITATPVEPGQVIAAASRRCVLHNSASRKRWSRCRKPSSNAPAERPAA